MHSFHYLSVALCALSLFSFQVIGFSGVQSNAHDRSRRLAHVRALSGIHQPRHDLSFDQSGDTKILKRDTFTFFQDGQGACGTFNGPNDFIVALNACDFDGGSHCFQTITITANGMSTQAKITDECPGCSCGGLDLSQGLFEFFAPTSVGELSGSWVYGTSSSSTSSTSLPSTTTKQSSTSTWTPSTTTTTSSTPTPTTTSTLAATTTSMSTTTSAPIPTTTSSTASPVPTFSTDDPQILTQVNLALIELGSVLQACVALSS